MLNGVGGGRRVAAFFDVDGTLISVQSVRLYIGYLHRHGLLSLADRLAMVWAYLNYRLGFLNKRKLARYSARWISGREERVVRQQCRDWYASEIKSYLCGPVVECVREHLRAGHVVVLLSGGTRYLNDLIAADLGVEHVVGTDLEVVDGRFTGRTVGPLCYAAGKLAKAERFAAAHDIELDQSYFYTDSFSDIPTLERVGHPRIVNPDPRLRLEAGKRCWTMVEVARG
ncbi:MAG: HAD family hydrolase [Deltaproteobacteria bacterium]